MTAIELLLNLATGQPVTPQEAQAALCRGYAGTDRPARIRARNRALLDAADLLAIDRPGTWPLAQRLEAAIERFRGRVWPMLRVGLHRELSPVESALYRAFLTGERVPGTARHLYALLKN